MAEGDMAYFPDKEDLTQAREDVYLLSTFDADTLWERFRGSVIDEKIYTRERSDLWAGFLYTHHFETLLKYKTSWDWQAPVWQKLHKLVISGKFVSNEELLRRYFLFQGAWTGAIMENDKDTAFTVTMQAVNWYYQMKDVVEKCSMSEGKDLMARRFKLVRDFWRNPYQIGMIFELDEERKVVRVDGGGVIVEEDLWEALNTDKYPINFKKLVWYQERKQEDMPMFLTLGDEVHELSGWEKDTFGDWSPMKGAPETANTGDNRIKVLWHFNKDKSRPATRREFLDYEEKRLKHGI